MASRFVIPNADVGNGISPSDGAKLFFFDTGTSDERDTFSDEDATIKNANPVIADGDGVFPDIFIVGSYKVVLQDKKGAQTGFGEADPINELANVKDGRFSKTFKTLAAAVTDVNLVDGDAVNIAERTAGNDGWVMADVVLSSSVTENTFNIVQCTGVPTLSLDFRIAGRVNNRVFGITEGATAANNQLAHQSAATDFSYIEWEEGTYKLTHFPFIIDRHYKALGNVTINFELSGGTEDRFVPMLSGCSYEGFRFVSTEDKDSSRVAIDDANNVYAKDIFSKDFTDTGVGNAWGVLIQRSSNIVLVQWGFENNTQADIALTDNCSDITIISPYNTADGGVLLNVEPNAGVGVRGMNVIGGSYRSITLLENDNTFYSSQNIVIQGAQIDSLTYDGSGVNLINCNINAIIPEGAAQVISFAGQFMCNTINLLPNLLTDSFMFDVSPSDANSFWTVAGTAVPLQQRFNESGSGKFCRINPDKDNASTIIATRDFIPVTAGETFFTFLRSRTDNTGTATNQVDNMQVQWFDSGNSLIKSTIIKVTRGTVNTLIDWKNDIGIVVAPALATSMKVRMSNSYTTTNIVNIDVARIGIYRFDLLIAGDLGNFPEIIDDMSKPVEVTDYVRTDVFLTTFQDYGGAFIGERIIKEIPSLDNTSRWVCTTLPSSVGFSGTFSIEATPILSAQVTATTAELIDITDAINTTAPKVDGFRVLNTDTQLFVFATGNADGDVWNFGSGNLAHTPV